MFSTLFYNPIYNLFVFILSNFTFIDAGVAIVLVTITVKIILFPLARSAIKTQVAMKKIKPELDALQERYKKGKDATAEDKQKMALEMMKLYKDNNVRPFSSIFVVLLQLPVLIALYWVFYQGGLPEIDTSILYSFVQAPTEVAMTFLGYFDLTARSFFLAGLAGATQLAHSYFAIDVPKAKTKEDGSPDMKADFARSFTMQMKYGLPLLITGIAYFFASAIAIYFITSNCFMLFQEWLVRKDKAELKNIS